MRRKSGLKSIQVDIPEKAYIFIMQQIDERRALTGETIKLSDEVRQALADRFHIPAELLSVRATEGASG